MKTFSALLLFLFSGWAEAQAMHQCKKPGGGFVLQEHPCPKGAQLKSVAVRPEASRNEAARSLEYDQAAFKARQERRRARDYTEERRRIADDWRERSVVAAEDSAKAQARTAKAIEHIDEDLHRPRYNRPRNGETVVIPPSGKRKYDD